MKKSVIILALLMTTLTFSACGDEKSEPIAVPIYNAAEIQYTTEPVIIGSISQTRYADGKMDYPYTESIIAAYGGTITRIRVNDEVKKGDLIMKLDSSELEGKIKEEKAMLDAAKKSYNSQKSKGGSDAEFAKINLDIEQNKYDKLLAELDGHEIYATCDGKLSVNYKAGDTVNKGDIIGTLVDYSQPYLVAYSYGKEIPDVNFGTSITAKQGSLTANGHVVDIIDNTGSGGFSGFYYVIKTDEELKFSNSGGISVVFNIYSKENVVLAPNAAIRTVGERTYVNALIDGSKVEIDVEVGIAGDNDCEIISGLSGNEKLIVN